MKSSLRVALAGLLTVGALVSACSGGTEDADGGELSAEAVASALGGTVSLYFPATSGQLAVEQRPVPGDLDSADLRVWIVEQIVTGPTTEGLIPIVPEETKVTGVFKAVDGSIFVDLAIPGERLSMGSTDEILALYSLVNSLLLNGAEDTGGGVILLVNGRQRDTFGGHVDTSRPLKARTDLVGELS